MLDTISCVLDDKKDDTLGDSHSILNRWEDVFCHLLNVRGVSNLR
jgi:hypothetical protein